MTSVQSRFDVAIVGMAGRFPGASDLEQFWANLRGGRESISFFTEAELRRSGVSPRLYRQTGFVNARAVLDDIECFDAEFFGFSAREAEITDPQQRLFLECSWEALENAGYDVDRLPGPVALFAGAATSGYFSRVQGTPQGAAVGTLRLLLGNDRDHLPAWVSYKLNLSGMSVNVQTACSTSLMAVHLARQALLDRDCDMALAGGVNVTVPQRIGYLYEESGILSHDGHCRAFDADATGTVPGEGLGVVVLKRLDDALRDGDSIAAVILGSAANNDGAARVSFGAPGVNGVAEVIATAQAVAGVTPGEVSLVEAHGSGTSLGDSIEVAALKEAFAGAAPQSIALGSVKTNIGHASAAAGIAGLIKTVLALEHRTIPPSLGFSRESPRAPLAGSPFFVNTRAHPWQSVPEPRRAGVTSMGIGGTNVHVVVEEAPSPQQSQTGRRVILAIWSARSDDEVEQMTERLAHHLEAHPELAPADVAYTLQVGRKMFAHRRAAVVDNPEDLARVITQRDPARMLSHVCKNPADSVVYMLPGTGDQYFGMGLGLYRSQRIFREHVDQCAALLRGQLGVDLARALYGDTPDTTPEQLDPAWVSDVRLSQPALFVIQYALANLWMSWGVRPAALIGYSLGEAVAACLAGVLSLEDALRLVATRAELMDSVAPGAMLAVLLDVAKLSPLLVEGVSLAAVNGPGFCVASGPVERIGELRDRLRSRRIFCREIHAQRAFHSDMMRAIAVPLEKVARGVKFAPPRIPYISNVTGTWISDEQATDPAYWHRHLCLPIRFWSGLETICRWRSAPVLLEVGAGQMLTSLVAQVPPGEDGATPVAIPSMRSSEDPRADEVVLLESLARLWTLGVTIDWRGFSLDEPRRRVPLPTYPFRRDRYWVEAPAADEQHAATVAKPQGREAASQPRGRSHLPRPYAPPSTPTEERVAGCWQDLLGVESVGIHDGFVELGGNSLIGGQLALRLQEAFHVPFPLKALFEHPTVAAMAAHIENLLIDEIETGADRVGDGAGHG